MGRWVLIGALMGSGCGDPVDPCKVCTQKGLSCRETGFIPALGTVQVQCFKIEMTVDVPVFPRSNNGSGGGPSAQSSDGSPAE